MARKRFFGKMIFRPEITGVGGEKSARNAISETIRSRESTVFPIDSHSSKLAGAPDKQLLGHRSCDFNRKKDSKTGVRKVANKDRAGNRGFESIGREHSPTYPHGPLPDGNGFPPATPTNEEDIARERTKKNSSPFHENRKGSAADRGFSMFANQDHQRPPNRCPSNRPPFAWMLPEFRTPWDRRKRDSKAYPIPWQCLRFRDTFPPPAPPSVSSVWKAGNATNGVLPRSRVSFSRQG